MLFRSRKLMPMLRSMTEPPILVGYCLGGTLAIAAAQLLSARALATIAAPWHFDRFPDSDRQLIAWSDYGPVSGKPVLLVHSNWTCRAVPRMMVMQLQMAGWRPIAIDRPGFGMTRPGSLSLSDPFGQAVSDTVAVLDRLKIARAAVITRRAGQFTSVLKRALGERIGPIILTSPSVPTIERGLRRGIVGVIKEAFSRSPQLVGLYFRLITPQL